MGPIKVFNFEGNQVRNLTIDDEPYFVGKDVAAVLGYKKPSNALAAHVDEEDKTTSLLQGHGSNYKSTTTLINESGLYALIFGSQLESAKRFKRWVTAEVLPQIRNSGKYEATPKDPMEIMRLQFEALDQTNKEVKAVQSDVKYLKEEVKLDAGEYSYVSKRVNLAVSEAVRVFSLASTNEVRAELHKDINGGVKKIADIKTRTQLKQKHFNAVIDYIQQWTPSTVTLITVRQLTLEFEERQGHAY